MTLKARLWIYLGALHAALAGALFWQRAALGWWLFALELALIASFVLGVRLLHAAFVQADMARRLAGVIESGEYGARYPLVGHAEADAVISAYNRMLSALQQERFRLGEQRGFAEKFLQDTPVGVLIFDFDDKITFANPKLRALLGAATDDELAGRTLRELDAPFASALAALAVDETRMITDTAGRRLRCRLSQFSDRGFPRKYVLIEELTAELNRSERETYEKLIRMMSHEVTNTVAATNSLLESCRTYATDLRPEPRSDYENALDVVIARNRSLNEFTKGFSDLVKLPEPQCESVDLRDLLHPLRTMFKVELDRRNVALDIRVEPDVPLVSMDRNQMEQVLLNVMRNALEAIERDGEIDIVARRAGRDVDLSVFDTGIGLNDETKARLFTPFFTSKRHGQGLGLMLVKEILTQHGFAFSLDAAGGRTCFSIRMPVALEAPDPLRA